MIATLALVWGLLSGIPAEQIAKGLREIIVAAKEGQ